jgi:hypothetical protein
MNDIQNIITERVDDIPLLLAQMQRMNLPTLIDHHFPTHGNWQGLSLGWVSTMWLSSILSRGDHRLVHVEPWVNTRLWTLRRATDQAVEPLDFTDDRLERVLQHLSDDMRWAQFESALNQQTVRVYDLSCERISALAPSSASRARGPRSSSGGLGRRGGGAGEKRGFILPIRSRDDLDGGGGSDPNLSTFDGSEPSTSAHSRAFGVVFASVHEALRRF